MADERFKNLGEDNCFKELLERIRDIRFSEKVFYRQLLDLFATSVDYKKDSGEAKRFFTTVRNKLHFSIHYQTPTELGDNEEVKVITKRGLFYEYYRDKEIEKFENLEDLTKEFLKGFKLLMPFYLKTKEI